MAMWYNTWKERNRPYIWEQRTFPSRLESTFWGSWSQVLNGGTKLTFLDFIINTMHESLRSYKVAQWLEPYIPNLKVSGSNIGNCKKNDYLVFLSMHLIAHTKKFESLRAWGFYNCPFYKWATPPWWLFFGDVLITWQKGEKKLPGYITMMLLLLKGEGYII